MNATYWETQSESSHTCHFKDCNRFSQFTQFIRSKEACNLTLFIYLFLQNIGLILFKHELN